VRAFSRTGSAIQNTTAPVCSMDGSLEILYHRWKFMYFARISERASNLCFVLRVCSKKCG